MTNNAPTVTPVTDHDGIPQVTITDTETGDTFILRAPTVHNALPRVRVDRLKVCWPRGTKARAVGEVRVRWDEETGELRTDAASLDARRCYDNATGRRRSPASRIANTLTRNAVVDRVCAVLSAAGEAGLLVEFERAALRHVLELRAAYAVAQREKAMREERAAQHGVDGAADDG